MESPIDVQSAASEEKGEGSNESATQNIPSDGLSDDQKETSHGLSVTVGGAVSDKRSTTLLTEVATKKACIRTDNGSVEQDVDKEPEKTDKGLQQVSSRDHDDEAEDSDDRIKGEGMEQEAMDVNTDGPIANEEPMDASQHNISKVTQAVETTDSEVGVASHSTAHSAVQSNDSESHVLSSDKDSKLTQVTEGVASDKSNAEGAGMTVENSKGQRKVDIDQEMQEGSTATATTSSASRGAESHSEDDAGASKPSASSLTAQEKEDSLSSVYYLKWFPWQGVQTPLVTQNENGPCPLLAIANVLMLSHKIQIPSMQEFITAQQLMEYIGDYILSLTPKENNDEEFILNYEQNMQDAIAIMHKLQTGIDVNVKFTGCKDFEFTSECVVFDLLHIGLYHGWLVDPQDDATLKAIGSLSYNQIVEKIIASKEANTPQDAVAEGVAAECFLEQTASQLSYHGLYELNSCILPGELCVFFRNNHFSTLYKHNDKLFLLVTDQGYLTEPRIIWETLSNVEGDGEFVNADFKTVGPMQSYGPAQVNETATGMTQEDRDYLVALSLQEKGSDAPQTAPTWDLTPEEAMRQEVAEQERKDRMFAMRLQEQERQLVAQQQRQQRPTESHMVPQGRPYAQGAYSDNRVRVGHQGQGLSEEDRQQQGKCCIL